MSITNRGRQAAQTKDTIIRVALELIGKYGYQDVSIRRLCKEAGISTGAFYHHFSSKDEMINAGFALYDEHLDQLLEEFAYGNPVEDIRFILLNQTRFVMENTTHLTKELYVAQLTTSEKYLVKPERRYYKTVRSLVVKARGEGKIASGLSDDDITGFLLRTNRGVILDWCFHDYAYDLLEQAKQDLDFILGGLFSP